MNKTIYPYLKDSAFLLKVDNMLNKEQIIKIIVLDKDENPIQTIEGKATGGNLNINAASSIRRTGSLSLIADEENNDLTNVDYLFSMNKKAKIEMGIINTLDDYLEYPILWFPLGTFIFSTVNLSRSTSGITLSLNLDDKMSQLNGAMGGAIPSIVEFHENGYGEKVPFYTMIFELVHHWGGEQPGKIIIDVPEYFQTIVIIEKDEDGNPLTKGYRLVPACSTQEIKSNIGDSVVSILDKIKTELGNYEYFYDIDGNFVFREIKNYLNTSYSSQLLDDMSVYELNINNFIIDQTKGKSIYNFDNSNLITTFSNNPDRKEIKNEFIVWGKASDSNGLSIRYRLAIDSIPALSTHKDIILYRRKDGETVEVNDMVSSIVQAIKKYPQEVSSLEELKPGYATLYDGEYYVQNSYDEVLEKPTFIAVQVEFNGDYTPIDYRTELYLQGIESSIDGTTPNRYFEDLRSKWPSIYDLKTQKMKVDPTKLDYYLDIIDTENSRDYSISSIGERVYATNNDKIGYVFNEDNSSYKYYIFNDQEEEWFKAAGYDESLMVDYKNQTPIQGASTLDAFSVAREALYQKTQWASAISIAAIPIYYLEPNHRITVNDSASDIHGDYLINSISLPFDLSGTMTLSCSKVLDKM